MKNIRYIGAGAGSGKTFDLTEKIVSFVLEGHKMSELILTTFTKKAAAEFRKKTREKLLTQAGDQEDPVKQVLLITAATELDSAMIGTVHSVCMQYIRKYWYKLGVSARVKEMDDDAKTEHMNKTLIGSAEDEDLAFFQNFAYEFDIRENYGRGKVDTEFWKRYLAEVIESADSFDINDLSISEEKSQRLAAMALSLDGCGIIPHEDGKTDDYYRGQIKECIARIFKIARKWRDDFRLYKEEQALIQFSDMESRFLELLDDHEVREEISYNIKFLFVDEFQDSNPKQVKIFDRLSDLVQESFWVGDPKQSIYKFRGSDIELVRAVINKKGGDVIKEKPLEYSWRSERHLVETANQVFSPVFAGILSEDEIVLTPHREDTLPGGVRSLHHWDLRKGPNPFKENALGCTKDMLALAIAGQVADIVNGRHEIHRVIDKDTGEPRDIIPTDIAVLTRSGASSNLIINHLVERGIPVIHEDKILANSYELQCVALLLNYMITRESSLLDAELCRLLFDRNLEDILKMKPEELRSIASPLDHIREEIGGGSISGMVRGIIFRLDLLNLCGKWGWKEERRKNLMCLIKAAEDYDSSCLDSGQSATVEGFLSEIAEGIDVPEGYSPGGVTVCTYHKSKGLEWGVVILYDLNSDCSSEKICLKRYVTGTKIVRMNAPTSENIYSDYYITMVPAFSNSDIKGSAAQAIMDTAEFREFQRQEIAEAQRLLYVGFTRARDYLVSTSNSDNRWPHGLMMWVDSIGIKPNTVNPAWADGTLQEIWGPGTEPCNFRKINAIPADKMKQDTTFSCHPQTTKDTTTEHKRIMPSALPQTEDTKKATLRFLGNDNGDFIQNVRTVRFQDKETAIGTCIHNIFAVYDPAKSVEQMNEIATRTVKNFSLEKNIPEPESIIQSIATLYEFLTKTYGPAVKTEKELPFRRVIDGQTCVGSIDLVWYTSEKECVLVDYKNLSMATAAVVDPDSEEYLGHYIPQQKAYRDELERSGLKVRDCILHLSLQGRVIVIDF